MTPGPSAEAINSGALFLSGAGDPRELLAWGTRRLGEAGYGSHESRILLQWALGVDSLLQAPTMVPPRAAERFRSAIHQRRAGAPLQHVTGEMHFRHLTLPAGPGVFVVRPETEALVDLVAEALAEPVDPTSSDQPVVGSSSAADQPVAGSAGARRRVVVDLCTGSGAIGLAVATEIPGVQVHAVELSALAAAYARRSYDRYQAELAAGSAFDLTVGDALTAVPAPVGEVDVVVANPPYVPSGAQLPADVRADPAEALFGGGEDGLIVPRGLVRRAAELLRPGGTLLMEHDETQGAALRAEAAEAGFVAVETLPDLAGRDRYLQALLPSPASAGPVLTDSVSDSVSAAATAVARGDLIVLPTDTVYGIAANPFDARAVDRLLSAKGRTETAPPPVLVADAAAALDLVDWSRVASRADVEALAAAFWPGALTLVVPTIADLGWDITTHGGTVAVRVPDDPLAREVLAKTGPLAVTSANPTGRPPATDVQRARSYFDESASPEPAAPERHPGAPTVAVFLDGGPSPRSIPSTIVALTSQHPTLLRAGALEWDEILAALPAAE